VNAMDFFQRSAGVWRSLRTTHHLPFRRAESGGSRIAVEPLPADHPQAIAICEMHDVDPSLCVGGAQVNWDGAMAWDRDDESHAGSSVFSIVPDPDNPQTGRILRERGYAEVAPVIGRYEIDGEALVLTTEYETMSTVERFWFAGPDLRLRTSTVQRFGGFNTATFCAEVRLDPDSDPEAAKGMPEIAAADERPALSAW